VPQTDTQQVCMNGHQMTDSIHRYPESGRRFCPECGEPTITACPSCNAPIPGHVYYEGVFSAYTEKVPGFCGSCGKPYPWTRRKIENFRELTDELDELSAEDREKLNASLDELIRESPKAEVASLRFKKVATKLGKDSYELVQKVATDLLSETIRKALFGP
jgi:hypothetical protein